MNSPSTSSHAGQRRNAGPTSLLPSHPFNPVILYLWACSAPESSHRYKIRGNQSGDLKSGTNDSGQDVGGAVEVLPSEPDHANVRTMQLQGVLAFSVPSQSPRSTVRADTVGLTDEFAVLPPEVDDADQPPGTGGETVL